MLPTATLPTRRWRGRLRFYDPFGQTLRMTGPMAKVNPIRFSTQWADDDIGDIKYLYRDYSPSMGRWLSRDLIKERGGKNLYGFVNNNPIRFNDKRGLFPFCNKCPKLNAVVPIKEEWEIGSDGSSYTPDELEYAQGSLTKLVTLSDMVEAVEVIDGNPSILFPKVELGDQNNINNILMFEPVNAFGRIKYKVCQDVGPRFIFFGSDQLDWITYQGEWNKKSYGSGADAVADAQPFMDQILVDIKNQYPDQN